jgi:hypothetical protein
MDDTRLAALTKLEISLKKSLQALLVRDIAGLQRFTGEQRLLASELSRMYPAHVQAVEGESEANQMRSAANRILSLGRVQSVLLGRQQQRLGMLWHFLSARGRPYSRQMGIFEAEGHASYSERG